jgi:crotonobetainyl-CoA:carnitine CoA-transferase CaiB-like acyl-CoA transferase
MSGFMSVNGPEDGDPMRAAPPMSDMIAGLYSAFGVVTALQARHRTGKGQNVESSLTNGLISMMAYLSAEYFATGKIPKRTGNNHPIASPYGLFRAIDGRVAVAPSNDVFVERFLNVLNLGYLLEENRFKTNTERMVNRDALLEIINKVTEQKTVDHWISIINEAGCPCGRTMDLSEVFSDPQVLSQEMLLEVEHPGHGPVKMTGFPVKLSATPAKIHRPTPELGAHTDAILNPLRKNNTL